MKMMGLPGWLNWAGWLATTLFTSTLSIIVMVFVLIYFDILVRVDPLVLFISFLLYSLSTICFNFAQSTLFSSRKFSAL